MNKLTNKVAVVTGASKVIGAAIAKYFAAEGARVVVKIRVVTGFTFNTADAWVHWGGANVPKRFGA